MNAADVLGTFYTVIRFAALALAAAALLKMFGFVAVRPSVMELAAVAIACALVSR